MMFPIFIPIKAKIIGIGLIVISVYFGFTGSDGIAHFAHLGGGIMGMILVKFGERTQIFNIARKHIRYGLPSQEGPQGQAQYPNPNYNYDAPKQHSVSWGSSINTNSTNTNTSNSTNSNTNSPPKSNNIKEFNIGGQKVTQEVIDAIIDKISQSGYASLTEQEKFILTEVSKKM